MNSKKIVIVDDDEICCILLKGHLEPQGYDVSYLTESLNAIKFIQEKKPELVILDLYIPGKDGFEILDELGEDKPYVIAISSRSMFIKASKGLGANEAYLKDDLENIVQAVNHYFNQNND